MGLRHRVRRELQECAARTLPRCFHKYEKVMIESRSVIQTFRKWRDPTDLGTILTAPDRRLTRLRHANIDRAAGHPCQGDDGYGSLQQHQHLGASGKQQSVGRTEREARCERNEQIVRVTGTQPS